MKIFRKIVPVVAFFAGVATLHADTPLGTEPLSPGEHVPGAELQMRAQQVREQMQTDVRYVMYLQAQARQQKDVIKLNCVNDKLIQIKAEMNIGDSANELLTVAIAQNTGDKRAAFDQLTEVGNAVKELRQQASACLGEAELIKQESGGTFSHPAFPDDPTIIPFDVYTEPPAYASPFN